MLRLPHPADTGIAIFVFATAALLLVPLPTFILDLLITLNIAFSFLLLLISLYMPNALALLAFPSLLLLTTLFRLGLNVASCRLILTQADAGQVIESFGTFLIRGEIAVGIIIFSIVTVVNYLVVAKGSSRVSVVAARFALDALPGKQITIDSDLRAGLISPEEAQTRRDDLAKESRLFGAMDGAMNFVQGDAIAGIVIIFANILGGMYIGLTRGMSFQEAIETYTILTVGDGLVSQIPAIMISICAGIVVTRVSSNNESTLGSDISRQLFSKPGSLFTAGCLLTSLGLLPGLPWLPFFLIGGVFMGSPFLIGRFSQLLPATSSIPRAETLSSTQLSLPSPGSPSQIRKEEELYDPGGLVMSLHTTTLHRFYQDRSEAFTSWWQRMRHDVFVTTGIPIPHFTVQSDSMLSPSGYRVECNGVVVLTGIVQSQLFLCELNPDVAFSLGLEVTREETFPLGNNTASWVTVSPTSLAILDTLGATCYDALQGIGLQLVGFFRQNPEEVITLTYVHYLLKGVEKRHPGLLADALQKELVDASRLTEISHDIIRDGMSIRDFRQVIEHVAAYCSNNRAFLGNGEEFDRHHVLAFIRLQRRRHLLGRALSHRRTLKVITLDGAIEDVFDRAPLESGFAPLALEPSVLETVLSGLQEVYTPMRRFGVMPVTLLCRSELRAKISNFLRTTEFGLSTLAFDELEPGIDVEQVGVWKMSHTTIKASGGSSSSS
jgi:type III secretion protein V